MTQVTFTLTSTQINALAEFAGADVNVTLDTDTDTLTVSQDGTIWTITPDGFSQRRAIDESGQSDPYLADSYIRQEYGSPVGSRSPYLEAFFTWLDTRAHESASAAIADMCQWDDNALEEYAQCARMRLDTPRYADSESLEAFALVCEALAFSTAARDTALGRTLAEGISESQLDRYESESRAIGESQESAGMDTDAQRRCESSADALRRCTGSVKVTATEESAGIETGRAVSIGESEARRIASEWHSGQWSALYSFSSSGYVDRNGLMVEIERINTAGNTDSEREEVNALYAYVENAEDDFHGCEVCGSECDKNTTLCDDCGVIS